ncbi:VOC family protein [Jannaschia sp. LMIT008]|uniref:VOC family protein n=1 Tax=Jannaschia maritima TaxID=3032585 RepID=UPI0028122D59|nr:VOC family protein [Jannaschia sp. LMIT008]
MTRLEHLNVTVPNADATAATLCDLFGWRVRWSGTVLEGAGRSVHVGEASNGGTYLALYSPKDGTAAAPDSYATARGLNHVALIVDDLDAMDAKVRAAGYVPGSHAAYEPGRRFYFDGPDGIEFELVSYG